MPRPAIIYRILVASSSDIVEELPAIAEAIRDWNVANSLFRGVYLEPVLFKTHASPKMGGKPQAIVNKQLVKTCDILIGIFWSRLDTPTRKAESGIFEEIEAFRKARKPVLLYFSSAPIVLGRVDIKQYKRLLEFKEQYQQEEPVFSYKSTDDLRDQVKRHITTAVNSIHGSHGRD